MASTSINAVEYFALLGRSPGPFQCKLMEEEEGSGEFISHPRDLWLSAITDITIVLDDEELELEDEELSKWTIIKHSAEGVPLSAPYLAIQRRQHSGRVDHITDIKFILPGQTIPKNMELIVESLSTKHSAYISGLGYMAIARASESAMAYMIGQSFIDDVTLVLYSDEEDIPYMYHSADKYYREEKSFAAQFSAVTGFGKKKNKDEYDDPGIGIAFHLRSGIGLCDIHYETACLDRYPRIDYPNLPLPEKELPSFAFPMIMKLEITSSNKYPLPKFFSFVFNNSDGGNLYAACLRFYERVSHADVSELFESIYGDDKVITLSDGTHLYSPKVICVISSKPFYRGLRRFLKQLYSLSVGSNRYPLEYFIYSLVNQVSIPIEGGRPFHVSLDAALISETSRALPPIHFRLPAIGSAGGNFPFLDMDFSGPLTCLSVENMLTVFTLLLTEHKIAFVCNSGTILTETMEAFRSLLFPLRWTSAFISRLPLALKGLLQAPGGCMVGLHLEDYYANSTDKYNNKAAKADTKGFNKRGGTSSTESASPFSLSSSPKASQQKNLPPSFHVWLDALVNGTYIVDLTNNAVFRFESNDDDDDDDNGNNRIGRRSTSRRSVAAKGDSISAVTKQLTLGEVNGILEKLPLGPRKRLQNYLNIVCDRFKLGPADEKLEDYDSAFDIHRPNNVNGELDSNQSAGVGATPPGSTAGFMLNSKRFPTTEIRDAFMVLMCEVIGDYYNYILPVAYPSVLHPKDDMFRTFKESFAVDLYLEEANTRINSRAIILHELVTTQMFNFLLQERQENVNNSVDGIAFFEKAGHLLTTLKMNLCYTNRSNRATIDTSSNGINLKGSGRVAAALMAHQEQLAEQERQVLDSKFQLNLPVPVYKMINAYERLSNMSAESILNIQDILSRASFGTISPAGKYSQSTSPTSAATSATRRLSTAFGINNNNNNPSNVQQNQSQNSASNMGAPFNYYVDERTLGIYNTAYADYLAAGGSQRSVAHDNIDNNGNANTSMLSTSTDSDGDAFNNNNKNYISFIDINLGTNLLSYRSIITLDVVLYIVYQVDQVEFVLQGDNFDDPDAYISRRYELDKSLSTSDNIGNTVLEDGESSKSIASSRASTGSVDAATQDIISLSNASYSSESLQLQDATYGPLTIPGPVIPDETKQSNGRESLSDVPSYTYQDWPLLQDSFFESAKSHVHLQVQRLKMERSVLLPTNTFRDSKQCIKGGIGGLMGEEPHQLMAYFIRPPQKRLAFCYTGTLASSLQLYSKHRHLVHGHKHNEHHSHFTQRDHQHHHNGHSNGLSTIYGTNGGTDVVANSDQQSNPTLLSEYFEDEAVLTISLSVDIFYNSVWNYCLRMSTWKDSESKSTSLLFTTLGLFAQWEYKGLLWSIDESIWRMVIYSCGKCGGTVFRYAAHILYQCVNEVLGPSDALTYSAYMMAMSATSWKGSLDTDTDSDSGRDVDGSLYLEVLGLNWFIEKVKEIGVALQVNRVVSDGLPDSKAVSINTLDDIAEGGKIPSRSISLTSPPISPVSATSYSRSQSFSSDMMREGSLLLDHSETNFNSYASLLYNIRYKEVPNTNIIMSQLHLFSFLDMYMDDMQLIAHSSGRPPLPPKESVGPLGGTSGVLSLPIPQNMQWQSSVTSLSASSLPIMTAARSILSNTYTDISNAIEQQATIVGASLGDQAKKGGMRHARYAAVYTDPLDVRLDNQTLRAETAGMGSQGAGNNNGSRNTSTERSGSNDNTSNMSMMDRMARALSPGMKTINNRSRSGSSDSHTGNDDIGVRAVRDRAESSSSITSVGSTGVTKRATITERFNNFFKIGNKSDDSSAILDADEGEDDEDGQFLSRDNSTAFAVTKEDSRTSNGDATLSLQSVDTDLAAAPADVSGDENTVRQAPHKLRGSMRLVLKEKATEEYFTDDESEEDEQEDTSTKSLAKEGNDVEDLDINNSRAGDEEGSELSSPTTHPQDTGILGSESPLETDDTDSGNESASCESIVNLDLASLRILQEQLLNVRQKLLVKQKQSIAKDGSAHSIDMTSEVEMSTPVDTEVTDNNGDATEGTTEGDDEDATEGGDEDSNGHKDEASDVKESSSTPAETKESHEIDSLESTELILMHAQCSCSCGNVLREEEVMSHWMGLGKNRLNVHENSQDIDAAHKIVCFLCAKQFTPRLSVECYMVHVDGESKDKELLWHARVPFLSSFGVMFKKEQLVQRYGALVLDETIISECSPEVYWNSIYYSHRMHIPTGLTNIYRSIKSIDKVSKSICNPRVARELEILLSDRRDQLPEYLLSALSTFDLSNNDEENNYASTYRITEGAAMIVGWNKDVLHTRVDRMLQGQPYEFGHLTLPEVFPQCTAGELSQLQSIIDTYLLTWKAPTKRDGNGESNYNDYDAGESLRSALMELYSIASLVGKGNDGKTIARALYTNLLLLVEISKCPLSRQVDLGLDLQRTDIAMDKSGNSGGSVSKAKPNSESDFMDLLNESCRFEVSLYLALNRDISGEDLEYLQVTEEELISCLPSKGSMSFRVAFGLLL